MYENDKLHEKGAEGISCCTTCSELPPLLIHIQLRFSSIFERNWRQNFPPIHPYYLSDRAMFLGRDAEESPTT